MGYKVFYRNWLRTDCWIWLAKFIHIKPSEICLCRLFQVSFTGKIEMITKCFCAGGKSKQASFLLDIGDATMQNFYKHFRQMIYEWQLNALKTHVGQKPKIAKMRRFCNIPVYFCLYDDELFVANKPLKTKRKKLPHTKEESLRIKVFYSRLRRSINHSQMKQNLAQHVAEHIWRYGKEYTSLYSIFLVYY